MLTQIVVNLRSNKINHNYHLFWLKDYHALVNRTGRTTLSGLTTARAQCRVEEVNISGPETGRAPTLPHSTAVWIVWEKRLTKTKKPATYRTVQVGRIKSISIISFII